MYWFYALYEGVSGCQCAINRVCAHCIPNMLRHLKERVEGGMRSEESKCKRKWYTVEPLLTDTPEERTPPL